MFGQLMERYYSMLLDIQDMPKLYPAICEWMSCMVIILWYYHEAKRKRIFRHTDIMAGGLILLIILQMTLGVLYGMPWVAVMFLAVLTMIWILRRCLEISLVDAAYLCTLAFLRAEFTASLEWQVYHYYFRDTSADQFSLSCLFCVLFYLFVFFLFYLLDLHRTGDRTVGMSDSVSRGQLLTVWLITLLVFAMSNLSYVNILPVQTLFTWNSAAEIFNNRTLIDLAGVCILELLHLQKVDADYRQEMESIQNVARMQYAQFRESQENIDAINRKYHDLKHQLEVIRRESDNDRRLAYIDEIEAGIRSYENEVKTGNPVLDTVLSSKSAQCARFHIKFTAVADGALLSHLHVTDLCTIFGNALDNAIEHEVQLNEDKRMIHVSVSERNSLICIVIENYYEGAEMEPGSIPETTKQDHRNHGFGIKSIRYTVDKYGGHLNVGTRDHWFRLEMILPKSI